MEDPIARLCQGPIARPKGPPSKKPKAVPDTKSITNLPIEKAPKLDPKPPAAAPPVPAGDRRILAMDQATKCGWAHSAGASGTWDLSIRRDESSGMRLIRLQSKLKEIFEGVGIDIIVYEAARHAAPKMQGALVVQAEIQGVIKLFCETHKIESRGYSPSEVKKHATGKGNANKETMVSFAKAKWPKVKLVDDNHADALHILGLALKEYA